MHAIVVISDQSVLRPTATCFPTGVARGPTQQGVLSCHIPLHGTKCHVGECHIVECVL